MLGHRVLLWGAVSGLGMLLCGVLVVSLWDTLMAAIITAKLPLVPGSEVTEAWIAPPVKPLLKIYYFNVTNPDAYLKGEVPEVQEVGPYTYEERWKREGMEWSENQQTVRSRMRRTYHHRPDLSVGSLDDLITLPNVPMFGMLGQMRAMGPDQLFATNFFLGAQNQSVFETRTVQEVTWGFPHPLVDLANTILPEDQKLPELYGFFYGKNDTADDEIVANTGAANIRDLGEIISFNNQTSLDFWGDEECDAIRGSDGSVFPPFLEASSTLSFFHRDLCRSLSLTHTGQMVTHSGMETMRFTPSPSSFTPSDSPCFSPAPTGLFNVSACQRDAPLLLSWPHFYGADPGLQEKVRGLSPSQEEHELQVDVIPSLGVGLRAAIRLQINLHIQTDGVTLLEGAKDVFLPIVWFSDGIESLSDPSTLALMDTAVNMPPRLRLGFTVVLLASGVLLLSASLLLLRRRREKKETASRVHLELAGGNQDF